MKLTKKLLLLFTIPFAFAVLSIPAWLISHTLGGGMLIIAGMISFFLLIFMPAFMDDF